MSWLLRAVDVDYGEIDHCWHECSLRRIKEAKRWLGL